MGEQQRLSAKSVAVLTLIAEGHSYGQIVDGHSGISYLDIFAAAEEALRLNETESDYHERIREVKRRYPRAYEKWTPQEDAELSSLHRSGRSQSQLAEHFRRQPSAI